MKPKLYKADKSRTSFAHQGVGWGRVRKSHDPIRVWKLWSVLMEVKAKVVTAIICNSLIP